MVEGLSEEERLQAERMAAIAARAEARAAAKAAGSVASGGSSSSSTKDMEQMEYDLLVRERQKLKLARKQLEKEREELKQNSLVPKFKSKTERQKKKKIKDYQVFDNVKKRDTAMAQQHITQQREGGEGGDQQGDYQSNKRHNRQKRRKLLFEWDKDEDTSATSDPLYDDRIQIIGKNTTMEDPLFSQKRKLGKNSKHWSEKSLSEMTNRDWRIVREDFDIHIVGGRIPNPARNFDEFNLVPSIREAIYEAGYTKPTPIQMQAIPIGMMQRDLIGVAETGSGKTAAFLIPLLMYLCKQPKERIEKCNEDGPLAIIMGPTRELVQQIGKEAKKLSANTSFRTGILVGGNSIQNQINELNLGVQIVAATPGRLIDCLENRYIVFNQCNYLVLDEADRMIVMGFEHQVETVLKSMKGTLKADTLEEVIEQEKLAVEGKEMVRVTIMFSATMPPSVERLAREYMRFPATVKIGDVNSGKNQNIRQNVYFVSNDNQKQKKFLELLRATKPPIIVFGNSRITVDHIFDIMRNTNYRATVLHSGKSQQIREANLEEFKRGKVDVLIATDVAGRGLDIENIQHVINFDMASDIERYTHRIGRTGRAGKQGTASTILTKEDEPLFADLLAYLKSTKSKVPRELEFQVSKWKGLSLIQD